MTPEVLKDAQQTIDVLNSLKSIRKGLEDASNKSENIRITIETEWTKNCIAVPKQSYEHELFIEYLDSMIDVLQNRFDNF